MFAGLNAAGWRASLCRLRDRLRGRPRIEQSSLWPLAGLAALASVILLPLGNTAALAEDISLDPNRNATRWLSERDAANFKEALRLADRAQWETALAYGKKISDPVASTIIEWRYLSGRNTYPTFTRLIDFVRRHPDWPDYNDLLKRAEESLPFGYDSAKVITAFAGQEPLTGDGKFKLGAAYIAQGQKDYGAFWIRQAWTRHILTPDIENRIITKYANLLTHEDHVKRLDLLGWYGAASAARRLYGYVSSEEKAAAEARIKLRVYDNITTAMSTVPKSHRYDPGLVYEQVRIDREADRDEQARAMLAHAPTDEESLVRGDLWWNERQILARRAIKDKLYGEAYRLAAEFPGKSGIDFAEAQWLAGWLALRFMDDPEQALIHFQTLYEGVEYPVSKARAAYWIGRSYERMSNLAKAHAAYLIASDFQTTFYGQLAAEKLSAAASKAGEAKLVLPPSRAATPADMDELLKHDVVKACILLHDFGQPKTLKEFVFHLADYFSDPATLAAYSELMARFGYPHYALKVAKKASLRNVYLIDQAYPVEAAFRPSGQVVSAEPAFVLGLARQESEFNPKAQSYAGAVGAMQLMPATAKVVARQHRISYNPSLLASDAGYNMTLGGAHLRDLVKRFGGSYILATAAYNAGPTRVRQWLPVYGDPRDPRVDPIDWIESIPIEETRNYVQRVMENTQIYRYRLARGNAPLLLTTDLGIRDQNSHQVVHASVWPQNTEIKAPPAYTSPPSQAAPQPAPSAHEPSGTGDQSNATALPQPKPVSTASTIPMKKPNSTSPSTTGQSDEALGYLIPRPKPVLSDS